MLPRRFRTRVLASVILIGTCLLVGVYYYGSDNQIFQQVPEQVRLWTLLWSAPAKCPARSRELASDRWNTADIYPKLDFSVPDNGGMGFWNDALESRYRKIRNNWKHLPLKVIVVPHSHVDAGWLRTYEDYHMSFVTSILDNMVAFLDKNEDFKFVWSEISFFAKWWEKQNAHTRSTVKKILQRQQLELVTGGWVMPDEAVTSYFANIDQLVEGHQWLQHFIGILPKHGWSVDVFGHSASYPYVLSSAGISKIVIVRTHYAWKKFFAETQSFDFYWKQPFPSPEVLCHMAPSDLYSFKYTCGPDPVVCLKFDFRHVEREYSESTADKITNENVKQKASYLLTQYGRFASLFPHNVLLVPLGDDFRYNVAIEWTQQLENYRKLFNYINNKKELNAHVQFGTVSDYFKEVNNRLYSNKSISLRSFEGDFLPYADIYANFRPSYWTGFYTTRPFYKKLSQELEYWLRNAEILYSLAKTLIPGDLQKNTRKDYSFLVSARQTLALFQHHDAITGTSRKMVMTDYCQKLHTGIIDAMSVVSHTTQSLLMEQDPEDRTWTSQFYPDSYRSAFDQPTKKLTLSVPHSGRRIILFNSLTVERTEIVRVKVNSPLVRVIDSQLDDISFQINPVFKDDFAIDNFEFELLFVASLKPMSYTGYTILGIKEKKQEIVSKTVVTLSLDNGSLGSQLQSAFSFEKPNSKDVVTFDSEKMRVTFSHHGHLKNIYLKDSGQSLDIGVDFATYHSWMYRSGAYLFSPDTKASSVRNQTDHFPLVAVIRGPLMSEINVMYHKFLKFSVRLYDFKNSPQALQLEVTSDLSELSTDTELVMRVKCDIKNKELFFTDSNGFQMLKRKYVPQLEVQGNYYPATTAMFIEDSNMRLNVLLPHSHGVTANDGEIEIMLDRRIHNDDGRGVGEGVEDNKPISSRFWFLPEAPQDETQLSPSAFWLSLFSSHPFIVLVVELSKFRQMRNCLSFLEKPWPSDIHLVNLRSLPSTKDYNLPSHDSLMILYRRINSCESTSFLDNFIDKKEHRFSRVKMKSVEKTLLTGTPYNDENIQFSSKTSSLQTCKIAFVS